MSTFRVSRLQKTFRRLTGLGGVKKHSRSAAVILDTVRFRYRVEQA